MCLGKRTKYSADAGWMIVPSYYLKNIGGPFIFYCNYDLRLLKNMPASYIDILKTWAEIHVAKYILLIKQDIREVIIWNNKSIGGKSVYWENCHAAGILRIKDFLEEDGDFL